MSRGRSPAGALLALALLSSPSPARADDDLESGRVIAVEARPYRLVHEFSASVGLIPLDALYTGFSLGGSYTLHLSDLWAWEAIDFHYSANVDTGLPVTLAERWSVAPTTSPEFQYMLASHVVFSPLFGKLTLFNSDIVHAETFLALGGGVARFSDGFRPALSVGPGLRLYFGQRVSTRLDIRSALVPDVPSGIEHVLQISLGVSFNFGDVRATDAADTERPDDSTGFEALDELYPGTDPSHPNDRAASERPADSEPSP